MCPNFTADILLFSEFSTFEKQQTTLENVAILVDFMRRAVLQSCFQKGGKFTYNFFSQLSSFQFEIARYFRKEIPQFQNYFCWLDVNWRLEKVGFCVKLIFLTTFTNDVKNFVLFTHSCFF
eukprot:TRINITY_DN12244_c3_g1_i1.p4 TRINITY_DN12244_c3_g1~~TRINITY_DN12244_c3_g1_i1.p4  ORF type:complete len:121 (+),score=11.41 TRINITY_DN12244_c3_g1_i1:724-1086(+)